MKHHLVWTALVLLLVASAHSASAKSGDITIYTDEYAGARAISHVAEDLIESAYDIPAEIKTVSLGPAFLGVAHDERSLFLATWLPTTHGDYMKRVGDQVDDLGTIYNGARLGWVVPAYVPKDQLASIEDLKKPAVQKKLDGRIQGISAGAGEMQVSHEALKTYGLDDYRITTASSAAMTAALARAIKQHQWIVATGWSPHWMWGRFDLRYLDDPRHALGHAEHVDAIASKPLKQQSPKVYGLISRMHFTLKQVNDMLADAKRTSYPAAAKQFIKTHPDLVKSWTEGGSA